MKRTTRFLSMLLVVVMLTGMLPISTLAEETGTEPQQVQETTQVDSTEPEATDTQTPTEEATEPSAEVTEPASEETEPENTEPEASGPETAEPEVTEPEVSEPEATEPAQDEPVVGEEPGAGDEILPEETETTEPEQTEDPNEDIDLASAEDDGIIYILAGSDFQPLDGSAATGVNLLNAILDQIPNYAFDGFLFAGDYNVNYDDSGCTSGRNAVDSTVTGKYPTITHEVYVQGNHDPDNMTGLSASGAHDADGYGVYVINEKDYMWYNNDESTIQNTASALDSYLDNKVAAGYNKPIFVVSHLPLHYSLRTQVGGKDGKYAKYIFDALQAAGEAGLNVIFLYGHNHSHGWDDYLGGAAVYLEPDDNINIAKEGSTTEYTAEALKFTYMNAGFVSYYRDVNDGACTDLTMTVFIIKDGQVEVERYSAAGQVSLKAAGVLNKSHWSSGKVGSCCSSLGTETYPADTSTVWEDVIPLRVVEEDKTVTDDTTNITITAPGVTAVTVEAVTDAKGDAALYSAHASWNITLEGYTQGEEATVSIPAPEGFDPNKDVTIWDGPVSDGKILAVVPIQDGKITFTTKHFSTYSATQGVRALTEDANTIYLLAGSDYHYAGAAQQTNVEQILNQIGLTNVDAFLFAGDYSATADDEAATTAAIDSLKAALTASGKSVTNYFLTQGNNDPVYDGQMPEGMRTTGVYNMGDYYVFALGEDAFPVGGGNEQNVKEIADRLGNFLKERMNAKDSKTPIFFVSHLPLLYGQRTAQDGDGKYANYIFEVINNAAHVGLSIFYIYGHNHVQDYESAHGGHAVYYGTGSRVPVPNNGSTTAYTERTLEFTYLNAGYVGNYNGAASGENLTMTLFAYNKTDGRVEISRYNSTGVTTLGAAGVADSTGVKVNSATVGPVSVDPDSSVTINTLKYNYMTTDGEIMGDDDSERNYQITIVCKPDYDTLGVGEKQDDGSWLVQMASVPALEGSTEFHEYWAFNLSGNADTVNVNNDFYGTLMLPLMDSHDQGQIELYKYDSTTQTLTELEYKIVATTDADGNIEATLATTKMYHGGIYVIACRDTGTSQGGTIYERIDSTGELQSGTYLFVLDGTTNYAVDSIMLPSIKTSGNYSGTYYAQQPYITLREELIVTQQSSDYEWILTLRNEEDISQGFTLQAANGAGYLVLARSGNSRYNLSLTSSASSATVFYADAYDDTATNRSNSVDETLGGNFMIRNRNNYYLTYNQSYGMITGQSGTSQYPRFVLFRNTATTTTTTTTTTGVFREVSGAGLDAMYRYTLDVDGLDRNQPYLIASGVQPQVMNPYQGIVAEASTIPSQALVMSQDMSTIYAAGTHFEWAIDADGRIYSVYPYQQNGQAVTYYLRNDNGLLRMVTNADEATLWTVRSVSGSGGFYYIQNTVTANSYTADFYLTFLAHDDREYFGLTTKTEAVRLFGGRTNPTATENLQYALADGESYYQVAYGTSRADAIAAVQAGITVYTTTSADTRPEEGTSLDDENTHLVWNLHESYIDKDPNNDAEAHAPAGYYPLEILYDIDGDQTTTGDRLSLGRVYVQVLAESESGSLTATEQDPEAVSILLITGDEMSDRNIVNGSLWLEGTTRQEVLPGAYTPLQLMALVQDDIQAKYTLTSDTSVPQTVHDMLDGHLNWEWVLNTGETDLPTDASGNVVTRTGETESVYYVDISYTNVTDTDGSTGTTVDLGTVAVVVSDKATNVYALSSYTAYVQQNASQAAVVRDENGSNVTLHIRYTDGAEVAVPVTVGMLRSLDAATETVSTATAGSIKPLRVYYNGVHMEYLSNVTLNVVESFVNNYPEYPDEGAVKVNKTATSVDFQASGIAQVELSASGIPTKNGADVIIMVDTSSSMVNNDIGNQTRLEVLENSLQNLISKLQTPGEDGQIMDIRVAVADFNGYQSGSTTSATTLDTNDYIGGQDQNNNNNRAMVYTGTGDLSAGAFVAVDKLPQTFTFTGRSGTNYDYAMDAIYQLGYAIRNADTDTEYKRDLFVVFLSDGAPFQWNYYSSGSQTTTWNNWLTGTFDIDSLTGNQATHSYYYLSEPDDSGKVNSHRMANAIKGSVENSFVIIRKNNTGAAIGGKEVQGWDNMYTVQGLGATMFSIAYDIQVDQYITTDTQLHVIESLATPSTDTANYYFNVQTAAQLGEAFDAIGEEIAYSASNARFTDQLGEAYSLQMATRNYEVVVDGKEESRTLEPKIEVLTYDVWTRDDYVAKRCTLEQVGVRKGTSSVIEVVMFSADGKKAYSSLIGNGLISDGKGGYTVNPNATADANILGSDGIIRAQSFLYNTNLTAVTTQATDGVDIPTAITANGTTTGSTATMDAESFYWKIGTITAKEVALRYYVYLEDAESGLAAGSYATNTYAYLYYDNYLGNQAVRATTSPKMAWRAANISYAFYLVNGNGEVVVNQTTGLVGSFANRIALTQPVVYQEVLLNTGVDIPNLVVRGAADDVLPDYYALYDQAAAISVKINSNGTGRWDITSTDTLPQTTYITEYNPGDANAFTNTTIGDSNTYDYSHVVVWFAVQWTRNAYPDTVVVDYGLPVAINVLNNDTFGEYGELSAVGPYRSELMGYAGASTLESGFGESYSTKYGTATPDVQTGKITYQLNTMNMPEKDVIAYAVRYTGSTNAGYYYGNVTVIPATSIYFEDSFLTLKTFTNNTETDSNWVQEGTMVDATQGEDRPGQYSLPEVDANNIYGYDNAYANMTTYSMGSAMKTTVYKGTYSTAEFTFTGTGFDVISVSSSKSGTIMVTVTNRNTGTEESRMVDTYYGYCLNSYTLIYTAKVETDENGDNTSVEWVLTSREPTVDGDVATQKPADTSVKHGDSYTEIELVWESDPDANGALYQVPVMKFENLAYGTYDVEIRAAYSNIFYHGQGTTNGMNSYDFYLDAIRIYNPANNGVNDKVIEDAYVTDKEGWPEYHELRDKILSAASFNAGTATNGVVYIDGKSQDVSIEDYTSYGPNNEVYLTQGNAVAFRLDLRSYVDAARNSIIADVQIGVKSADGQPVAIRAWNMIDGKEANVGAKSFETSTDLYYSLKRQVPNDNAVIVLQNTGTGIMSITNLKITFTQNPNATAEAAVPMMASFSITPEEAGWVLMSLSLDYDEPEAPEVTEPEVTEPEVTEPEVTEPEATEPEVTEPEVTEPEVTEPEVTEPEVTEPDVTEPEVTEPEATEPEVTEPEVTEPEVTEPEATEPEVTEPEVTEPEVTEPEVTEPEVTEPEVTEPEVTEPEATEPEVTEPEVTEPEVTEPEVTEPEATEPKDDKPNKVDKPNRPVINLDSILNSVKINNIYQNIQNSVSRAIKNLLAKWF